MFLFVFLISGGDKKEGSQNDLNRTSGGGRKKIVKVETKLVRPTRGSTASSRPSSAGSTQQSQGDSPPQAHLAKGNSAPSGGQTHNSLAQPSVNGVTNRAEDKPSTFELITDHHNPPPPPAPSSNVSYYYFIVIVKFKTKFMVRSCTVQERGRVQKIVLPWQPLGGRKKQRVKRRGNWICRYRKPCQPAMLSNYH